MWFFFVFDTDAFSAAVGNNGENRLVYVVFSLMCGKQAFAFQEI